MKSNNKGCLGIRAFIAVFLVIAVLITVASDKNIYFDDHSDLNNPVSVDQETYVNSKYDTSTLLTSMKYIYNDNKPVIEDVEQIQDEEVDPEPIEEIVHIVEKGDSFWKISSIYYGDGKYYDIIAEYNGLNSDSTIYIGDEIIIPNLEDVEIVNNLEPSKEDYTDKDTVTTTTSNSIQYSSEYKFGNRLEPAVDINIPTGSDMKNYTGEVDTSSYTYLGDCFITGYTPTCVHCTNSSSGIGASGVEMICGYSVAMSKDIPFGTTIYIQGYGYYVVEDRGVGPLTVDIACPTHEACGPVTAHNIPVYIVNK